jgi:hypothetical protein
MYCSTHERGILIKSTLYTCCKISFAVFEPRVPVKPNRFVPYSAKYPIFDKKLVVNDSELIVYKTLKSILDLAEAIKRVGSTAEQAGVDIDKLIIVEDNSEWNETSTISPMIEIETSTNEE